MPVLGKLADSLRPARVDAIVTDTLFRAMVPTGREDTINPEIYNKLPQLAVSPSMAVLADDLSGQAFTFLVNPEEIELSYTQERSLLNVLATDSGVSSWQYSQHRISLPEVKLWTPGNDRDLTGPLETLARWTQIDPPVLAFRWGSIGLERCYLESFSYRVTQVRSGKPTTATAQLSLLPAPKILEPAQDASKVVKLSAREIKEYKQIIGDTYPGKQVDLREDGTFSVDGAVIGNVLETVQK